MASSHTSAPRLPILAPRPIAKTSSNAEMLAADQRLALSKYHHTEAEWASVYPHIQKMYVQERRKLRYVMAHMEEKYGFKATSQMYKKRFTKWGLQKNARLSRREGHGPSSTAHCVTQRKSSIDLPLPMELGYRGADAQSLLFLNSIKSWSSAFFEETLHDSPHSDLDIPISTCGRAGEQPLDLEQLSFSFRLVAELLRRGHGIPAGRLARKSFLQVERILDLEGPLVTWDLLEILYNIAYLGQTSLFEMLVRHISNLAKSRLPRTHPLVQILVSLQDLMRRSPPDDSFLGITTLIERGWLLNAGFVFSNVHSRFQLMYHRLIWDSNQLRLPPAAPRRMSDSFGALRAENPEVVRAAADFEEMEGRQAERIMYATLSFSTHTGHAQRSRPPPNYEALRLDSIADLRRQSEMELMDQNMRLRVLMGLMKRGMPDSASRPSPTARDGDDDADVTTPSSSEWNPGYQKVPRLHVRVVAFMAKIALDTDIHLGIDKDVAVEKLRGIIALREYGQGATDPQVVYEFWQLRDLLAQGGRLDEADEAAREASKRLDIYLEDIPETL